MPVLEPNPPDGQRKFLWILGLMLGITVVIGVLASFLAS
ncbi:SGM_5486 family transporter-associated protein [Streptomyces sp. NPDC005438]